MIEFRVLGSLDLRGPGGETLLAVLAQPKRVALLAYLAVATPRGFHRRDKLLGLFWPERDQEHGRSALRKALYFLRQSLGEEMLVSRGDEEVGLAEGEVWCDAVAFEEALEGGDPGKALELYGGDLLEGFYISEAPEFERWLAAERQRLAGRLRALRDDALADSIWLCRLVVAGARLRTARRPVRTARRHGEGDPLLRQAGRALDGCRPRATATGRGRATSTRPATALEARFPFAHTLETGAETGTTSSPSMVHYR